MPASTSASATRLPSVSPSSKRTGDNARSRSVTAKAVMSEGSASASPIASPTGRKAPQSLSLPSIDRNTAAQEPRGAADVTPPTANDPVTPERRTSQSKEKRHSNPSEHVASISLRPNSQCSSPAARGAITPSPAHLPPIAAAALSQTPSPATQAVAVGPAVKPHPAWLVESESTAAHDAPPRPLPLMVGSDSPERAASPGMDVVPLPAFLAPPTPAPLASPSGPHAAVVSAPPAAVARTGGEARSNSVAFAGSASPSASMSESESPTGKDHGSRAGRRSGRRSWQRSRDSSFTTTDVPLEELLAARPVVSDEFDTQFRVRLKSVVQRNKSNALETVMDAHKRIQTEELRQLEEKTRRNDLRRDEAAALHERMVHDRKYTETIERNSEWQVVLGTVTFAIRIRRHLEVTKALKLLAHRLTPMISRKLAILRKRLDRMRYTTERLEGNPRPTLDFMARVKGDFFRDWSGAELGALLARMEPRSFRVNEPIMHDGDIDREMYILVNGNVEVMLRKKDTSFKQRNKDNSSACFQLAAPTYFGEFALLCKEPRSASIICRSACDCWVITQQSFSEQFAHLSAAVVAKLDIATDKRRKENLKKYFPLRLEALRKLPFFEPWSNEMLQSINGAMEPFVLRPGTKLFKEGDIDPRLFIVGEGTVRLYHEADNDSGVSRGSGDVLVESGGFFGEFETFFSQEKRPMSAATVSHCDIWALQRQTLMDIAMLDAGAVLDSRRIILQRKAQKLIRSPTVPYFFAHDPFVVYGVPPHAQQAAWHAATPEVLCAGDYIVKEGEDAKSLIAITNGSVQVRLTSIEWSDCNDIITIVPGHGITSKTIHKHSMTEGGLSRGPSAFANASPMKGTGGGGGGNTADEPLTPVSPTAPMHPLQHYCPQVAHHFTTPLMPRTASFRDLHAAAGRPAGHHGHGGGGGGGGFGIPAGVFDPVTGQSGTGVLVGGYEFAARKSRSVVTVRCASQCEVWRIDRQSLDDLLSPAVVAALDRADSIARVNEAWIRRRLMMLLDDSVPRPSLATRHHHHHHNAGFGLVGGGAGGGGSRRLQTLVHNDLAPLKGSSPSSRRHNSPSGKRV